MDSMSPQSKAVFALAKTSRLRKNEGLSSRSDILEQEAVVGGGAVMDGMDHQQSGMFSYISAERRVPKDHPLRGLQEVFLLCLHYTGSFGVSVDLIFSSRRFDAAVRTFSVAQPLG